MKALQFTLLVGLMLLQPLAFFGQRYGDEDETPLIPQEDFDQLLMWMVDGKRTRALCIHEHGILQNLRIQR